MFPLPSTSSLSLILSSTNISLITSYRSRIKYLINSAQIWRGFILVTILDD
jgi:hypothetical protein